jgi:hypothetical protein
MTKIQWDAEALCAGSNSKLGQNSTAISIIKNYYRIENRKGSEGQSCRGSVPGSGKILSSNSQRSDRHWTHPASYPIGVRGSFPRLKRLGRGGSYPIGVRGSFPRLKRLGRGGDHSPLSSAQVNNDEAMPPLPTRLHGIFFSRCSHTWELAPAFGA